MELLSSGHVYGGLVGVAAAEDVEVCGPEEVPVDADAEETDCEVEEVAVTVVVVMTVASVLVVEMVVCSFK